MKRFAIAVVAIAASGALALFAAGRTWGAATARGAVGARQHVEVSGRDVSSALPALAIALLALAIAVLAAHGTMRRAAGVLSAVCGVALVAVAFDARSSVGAALARKFFALGREDIGGSRPAWWVVVVIAGVVAAVAGVVVALRGDRWRGMGARYDAPVAPTETRDTPTDPWDALDHGDDPTIIN